MATYRIEEIEEGSWALSLIAGAVVLALCIWVAIYVGIPLLIIYITYRLIKRHKRKKKEKIEEEEAKLRESIVKRKEEQDYATNRLLELRTLYREGILSKEEYDRFAAPLIRKLNLVDRHSAFENGINCGQNSNNQSYFLSDRH